MLPCAGSPLICTWAPNTGTVSHAEGSGTGLLLIKGGGYGVGAVASLRVAYTPSAVNAATSTCGHSVNGFPSTMALTMTTRTHNNAAVIALAYRAPGMFGVMATCNAPRPRMTAFSHSTVSMVARLVSPRLATMTATALPMAMTHAFAYAIVSSTATISGGGRRSRGTAETGCSAGPPSGALGNDVGSALPRRQPDWTVVVADRVPSGSPVVGHRPVVDRVYLYVGVVGRDHEVVFS